MAQRYQSVKIKKTIKRVEVDSSFISEITLCVKREKKCSNYGSAYIWEINICEINKGYYMLEVTIDNEINKDLEYTGYFYVDSTLFTVFGPIIDSLFFPKEKRELEFTILELKNPKDFIIDGGIEDYSTWIYLYNNGVFFLKESYPLPCDTVTTK